MERSLSESARNHCGIGENRLSGFLFALTGHPERALALWELSLNDGRFSAWASGEDIWKGHLIDEARGGYLRPDQQYEEIDHAVMVNALRACSRNPACYTY